MAPVFLDVFSLEQVYLWPRAYWHKNKNERQETILEDTIESWLIEKNDYLKLITGGPGIGKSSFSKMFAAKLSRNHDWDVFLIPLHLLALRNDFKAAVEEQLSCWFDGFDLSKKERPFLLILDGLDEIEMQAGVKEAVRNFINQLVNKVAILNNNPNQAVFKVILTGRDLAIEAAKDCNCNQDGQILHILPYNNKERQEWWNKYRNARGDEVIPLPPEFTNDNLKEITSQPLLNYLTITVWRDDPDYFIKNPNINQIYFRLFENVHERVWGQKIGGKEAPNLVGKLEFSQFMDVLEDVGLAIWHSNSRSVTQESINQRCTISKTDQLLRKLEGGDKNGHGIDKLLLSFYFRGNEIKGEKTYEFTHKSFG